MTTYTVGLRLLTRINRAPAVGLHRSFNLRIGINPLVRKSLQRKGPFGIRPKAR
jgi:hypothetical protein